MLFKPTLKPSAKAVFIQTHIPRTGGTSLRLLFQRAFGKDAFIHNYDGELDTASAAQIDACRFTAGHVPYGVHRYFKAEPYYITVTRDPISRYQSLYAEFLTNKNSKLHAQAARYDIDDFLKFCLESDQPHIATQVGNLQCRLVSGSSDFQQARDFIDKKYLLACPLPELEGMVAMLGAFIGTQQIGKVETIHRTASRMDDLSARLRLTDSTLNLLLETDEADFHLHSYVQQSFKRTEEDWQYWQLQQGLRPAVRTPTVPVNIPIPPKELRFMAETDDGFVVAARSLAEKILNILPEDPGPDFKLLDVGCGYGRLAYGLKEREFRGRYEGFDILSRQIGWLNQNFKAGEAYRFHHVNLHNERYNPHGHSLPDVYFPLEKQAFDCMVALSVFTHMYEDDIIQYIRRIKDFLKDGGLFIATFFRIHPGFKLGDTFPNSTFGLVKQVSPNSFIASEDEPLWVIAYREAFLLSLFAREGFDVVAQRKGRWLTEADSLELQDWFVLRKKPAPLLPFRSISIKPPSGILPRSACVICGGEQFGPGPNGRQATSGAAPCCQQCGSLERHRAVRSLFHCLPIGCLNWRRGLLARSNTVIRPDWLRSLDDMALVDAEHLMEKLPSMKDGGYDLIVLDQVLEFIKEDRLALKGLTAKLSARGVLLVIPTISGQRTGVDHAAPVGVYRQWHAYGADLCQHFQLEDKGISALLATAVDGPTGTQQDFHLLFKAAADHQEFQAHLDAHGQEN